MYEYEVTKIVKVIDGDTVRIDVALGFHVTYQVTLRLNGIDTPELRDKDKSEKLKAYKCKDLVSRILDGAFEKNERILLKSKGKTGKYGRWIGDLIISNRLLGEQSLVYVVSKYLDVLNRQDEDECIEKR